MTSDELHERMAAVLNERLDELEQAIRDDEGQPGQLLEVEGTNVPAVEWRRTQLVGTFLAMSEIALEAGAERDRLAATLERSFGHVRDAERMH